MSTTHRMTPARRAALHKAQMASAAKRRGHSNYRSQHYYGKGLKGYRNAKLATYGSRRHGLSIAQQQRRHQRARKWAGRGAKVAGVGAVALGTYLALSPGERKWINVKARDYAVKTHNRVKYRGRF
jgi:hypothetical protein